MNTTVKLSEMKCTIDDAIASTSAILAAMRAASQKGK